MKHVRKVIAAVLTALMALVVATPAWAQTSGTAAAGKGSITIENAAKGEKYAVVKLFDATLSDDNEGIAYTGTIPEDLESIFEKDSAGNIHVIAGQEDNVITEVQKWAAKQSATEVTSDGSALTFEGLDYGYYAVKSSQGTVITIDSTKPDATVYDKNTKTITADKKVEKESYSIGDTIKYTATFDTVNFYGEGKDSKQVINYTITDTLPDFMSEAKVTKITVTKADGETSDAEFTNKTFNTNGEIVLDWADEVAGTSNPKKWTSKYDNGAKIIVEYEAKLNSTTNIDAADTNTVKIQPQVVKDDGTPDDKKPWDDNWEKSAEIKTFAAALKKVDSDKHSLKGAEFTAKGLVVEASDTKGVYTVVSYSSAEDAADSDAMSTDDNGKLYIVGLASDVELSLTETKAPDGYNKLDKAITLKPQQTGSKIIKESGTINYDKDGNVIAESSTKEVKETKTETANLDTLDDNAVEVVNNKGTELPETGGMGTTILYAVGGALVVAGGVWLLTKKRMASEQ